MDKGFYVYPLVILEFIKEQLDNENLVKSFSGGELENNNAQTHWGYDDTIDDEYINTEIRYEGYQKKIYLKDCFDNKYLIRIDCLEDKEVIEID